MWNVETHHSVGLGRWLALVAQPRVSYLAPYGAAQKLNVEPQRLLARAVLGNVAVQAGIDGVQWGQGGTHSLFLSDNAGPLRALIPPATLQGATPVMGPIPTVGQHTDAVLAELGLGDV